jgi:predicted lactoylglutathione lyase
MNLNQITLPVTDMEKVTAFYRRMGFLQIVDTPHYARFECPEGDATFSLCLSDTVRESAVVIYFECASEQALDEKVVELVQRGIEFAQPPQGMPWLWREAILFDPCGNKIKLYWAGENRRNPPWRVERTD